jgi:hypothetical protein
MKIILRIQVIERSKTCACRPAGAGGSRKNLIPYTLYLVPAVSLNPGILDPYSRINLLMNKSPHLLYSIEGRLSIKRLNLNDRYFE